VKILGIRRFTCLGTIRAIINARLTPNSGAIMSYEKNILSDRKIAILAADGFDESQLFSPKKALEDAGAKVVIVSLSKGSIKSWEKDHWGKSIKVDVTLNDCLPEDFDGLVIPGGEMNPNMLLQDEKVYDFVKEFVHYGKSVASICHGTKVLLETGIVRGKSLTTKLPMKKDVINSGAKWRDEEIVVHKSFITTRCAKENQRFNKKMIEGFAMAPKTDRSLLH
jgi:protease I